MCKADMKLAFSSLTFWYLLVGTNILHCIFYPCLKEIHKECVNNNKKKFVLIRYLTVYLPNLPHALVFSKGTLLPNTEHCFHYSCWKWVYMVWIVCMDWWMHPLQQLSLISIFRKRMTAEQSLNHPWISPQSRQQEEERRYAQTNMDNFKSYQARRRWKVKHQPIFINLFC